MRIVISALLLLPLSFLLNGSAAASTSGHSPVVTDVFKKMPAVDHSILDAIKMAYKAERQQLIEMYKADVYSTTDKKQRAKKKLKKDLNKLKADYNKDIRDYKKDTKEMNAL